MFYLNCVRIHNCVIVSGYTIVSWSFFVVQTFSFSFLKLFSFTFYFPSLKFSRCLPQKITSRYTIVWFVWRVHYCVQLLSWGHDFFWFFQSFPLPFPLLAKVFSFQLISFLVSFIWNSQKWPVSQNIWCLIKIQLKNITQTIFQEGSPWATLIHYKCYYFIRENDDKPEDSRVPNSQIPSRSPGRHEEAKERERVAHVVRETTRLHIEHF